MPFNISEFIANLPSDGLRSNLFEIQIFRIPTLLFENPTINRVPDPTPPADYFSVRAKAASIPASRIGIAQTPYYGRNAKFGGNRTFDNWNVTILMDENDYQAGGSRGFFERWMSLINSHLGNTRFPMYSKTTSYMGEARIHHKKKYAGTAQIDAAQYIMNYCYPIYVGPLQLDWGDNDRIAEFQVTFAYQWWSKIAPSVIL